MDMLFWAIFLGMFLVMGTGAAALSLYAAYTGISHKRMMERDRLLASTHIATLEEETAYLAAGKLQNTQGGEGFVDPRRGMYAPPIMAEAVPNSVHYAPHMIYKSDPAQLRGREDPADVAAVAGGIPSFAQLLAAGDVQPGRILLGYNEGAAVYRTWKTLYSPAIGGLQGSGKTTTFTFLAAQAALAGAWFVPIDPHREMSDQSMAQIFGPLASRFLCDPAMDGREISAAIRMVKAEIMRRKSDTARRFPYIFAVDEISRLMRTDVADALVDVLQDINQEGRKMGVFALAMGQEWSAETVPTKVRDTFASAIVHRMKPAQAGMLIPDKMVRQRALFLPAGHAWFYTTDGDLMPVVIPATTHADMATVAAMLPAADHPDMSNKSRPNVVEDESTTSASQSDKPSVELLSAEDAHILSLFREGRDIAEILKEVYGPVQGAQATRARTHIQAVIRAALGSM